ncbi:MAG: hypothetical protein OEZ58_19185 [Gammaproteobacteria bacterium]|nr:hypothetical protein [Gammaproteobacteria bacterium]
MTKLTATSLLVITLAFVLSACATKENNENGVPVNTAKTINKANIESAVGDELSSIDAEDEISSSENFLNPMKDVGNNQAGDYPNQIGEMAVCFEENASTTISQASGEYLVDIILNNITSCIPDFGLFTTTSASASVYFSGLKFIDVNGNEINPVNPTIGDLDQLIISQGILNMAMSINGRITNMDNSVTRVSANMLFTTRDNEDANKVCHFVNEVSGCWLGEKFTLTFNVPGQPAISFQDKMTMDYINLFAELGEDYYHDNGSANGYIDFVVNNWTGKMTYTSDGMQAPNYSATDGNDSISGTYSPSTFFAKPLLAPSELKDAKLSSKLASMTVKIFSNIQAAKQ